MSRVGEIKSAWSLANRLLERTPSFQRYKDMVQFKANYSVDDAEFLCRVEQLFKNSYRLPDQFNRVSEQTDALVLFYIDNQQFDQACEWVASNRVSTNGLLTLADLVVHDKPNHALSYYLRVVTVQIEQTSNEAYATALTLLQKIEGLLKSHPTELAQFYVEIASLAQSYKRKRNMLTLLKQHYAAHL
ncbi:hypothetical protein FG475_10005 [Vibrio navarrensis]|nr:hypothetical protein [Vibrio navarrensis]